jgi:tetratricopeptide (TPR) repeat protein
MILQQVGRKAEAAALFQKLLDAPIAEKLGADRLAWLAEFQLEQKQPDAAVKAANTLISLKPDKGWLQTAWTVLGRVHRSKGERDPAIHAFTEALNAGASTAYGAEAALRLGELLTDAGKFEEAGKHLNDAASRAASPELLGLRAHAYAGLARNAELKGDVEAALRYYMSVGILFDDATLVRRCGPTPHTRGPSAPKAPATPRARPRRSNACPPLRTCRRPSAVLPAAAPPPRHTRSKRPRSALR